MHPFRLACRLSAVSATLVLAACASPSPTTAEAAPVSTIPPATMVQTIRASAGDGDGELTVQPLRDPMVEDLRARAVALEAQGDLAGAVAALDEAMAIVDSDPALLQERAELAILQDDLPRATQLAERAYALGAQVGPLCRRHWITLEQVRLSTGDAEGATQARGQADSCRVVGPDRF